MKTLSPLLFAAALVSTGCILDRPLGVTEVVPLTDPGMPDAIGSGSSDAGVVVDSGPAPSDSGSTADAPPADGVSCSGSGWLQPNGRDYACMGGLDNCCSHFCAYEMSTRAQFCAEGPSATYAGLPNSDCESSRDCMLEYPCEYSDSAGRFQCSRIFDADQYCQIADPCAVDADCCTGSCVLFDDATRNYLYGVGRCNSLILPNGGACRIAGVGCRVDADCCGNICDPSTSRCVEPPAGACVELGSPCTAGSTCCGSLQCVRGYCRP
jgi:hypothetical protein